MCNSVRKTNAARQWKTQYPLPLCPPSPPPPPQTHTHLVVGHTQKHFPSVMFKWCRPYFNALVRHSVWNPPSSPTSIFPSRFSPSLISLMVSVDVKHHVYLLYSVWNCFSEFVCLFYFYFFCWGGGVTGGGGGGVRYYWGFSVNFV